MPLKSGYSPESIGNNIALMMREGKPHAQAIAISLEHGRREFRKHFPDKKFPRYLESVSRKRKTNPSGASKKGGFWNVYLNGKLIDEVWFTAGHTAYDVKTSLVDHDGYDPSIIVKQHKSKRGLKTNPVNKKHGFVIMVFGKGKKGYWTGLDWNTTLQRAHRYPSADQAKRVAEKLCLPAGYHIAVTS